MNDRLPHPDELKPILAGKIKGQMLNLVAGRATVNKGGRPKGGTVIQTQHNRAARAAAKATAERIAEMGMKAVVGEIMAPRGALRPDPPRRSVRQAKKAALHLINWMLWTIEGRAESEGVNSDDEARVLKLLAGLNAALPKPQEKPNKPIEEMTEEELRAYATRKSKQR